ncbi:hypothetical protein DU74_02230 [Methanosarcina mazei]|uniref:DUF2206 domain-containing protein n=1 Tax=Methanosarcina mazei TaxID=2209 RepID=A0A0F8REF9_METMZ|nr:DUF2206 domain-containing protein [Methanosarcina mazei]KKH59374.1 hypothetical protein DU74_02230 [Methanosarcina mazei]
MRISNPIQINDWDVRKFITLILVIQSLFLYTILFEVPILRQVFGFINLTFIPGILIIRVLKLHKIGTVETILYTVGLSVSSLMFIGLFANQFYPLLGASKPISFMPLYLTFIGVVLTLCFLTYLIDRDFSNPDFINLNNLFSPFVLLLLLLPFLSIFGTYLVNFYQNNILLILLLLIVSLIPLFVILDKFPINAIPLSVILIAISLLFHRSLISMNLWGSDVFSEYYYSNLVLKMSFWNSSIYSNLNAMLSVTMVPPIYSIICDMELKWVFKIINSLIYSFMPLGLYYLFQKQTNSKIAFLSVFFFMAFPDFYRVMPVVVRQDFGELFLMLLALSLTSKNLSPPKKALILLIFSISLIMSHYALASIYSAFFVGAYFIFSLDKYRKLQNMSGIKDFYSIKNNARRFVGFNFIILFLTFTLGWYIFVSESSTFETVAGIGNRVISNIQNSFDPNYSESLNTAIAGTTSPLYTALKFINIIPMVFITIGIIASFLKSTSKFDIFPQRIIFDDEYIVFSYLNYLFLICSLILPYFSGNLGTMRIFHLSLIFLAPFCIIGYISSIKLINKMITLSWLNQKGIYNLNLLSLFFMIFLLFNTGLIHEVLKDDNPCSISLSNQKEYLEMSPLFREGEVYGAIFLTKIIGERDVYSDIFGRQLLRASIWPKERIYLFERNTETLPSGVYIYFRKLNVENKLMVRSSKSEITSERPYTLLDLNTTLFYNTFLSKNKIYSNGMSEIYK